MSLSSQAENKLIGDNMYLNLVDGRQPFYFMRLEQQRLSATQEAQSVQQAEQAIKLVPEAISVGLKEELRGRLTPDQADFVAVYTIAANRVAGRAKELLAQPVGLAQLRERRDALRESLDTQVIAQNPGKRERESSKAGQLAQAHPQILHEVNEAIKEQIEELATTTDTRKVDLRSYDLAIMMLEHEVRRAELIAGIEGEKEALIRHGEIMKAARIHAKDRDVIERYPQAQNEHDRAFLLALDMKLTQSGYIPQFITVHDIDGNILETEDGSKKPGNIFGNLLDMLPENRQVPARQRLQLTDSMQIDPIFGPLAAEMLREAGRNTVRMFTDARQAVALAKEIGIDVRLLTANMQLFAEGVAQRLGDPSISIEGMTHDSFSSQEKVDRLLELLLQTNVTNAIYLMTDDHDRRLSEALTSGRLIDGVSLSASLEDLYFFAARQNDDDGRKYRMYEALEARGIAYAGNRKKELGNGQVEGYQGTKHLMELYGQWKEQRLSQGWAENELTATAHTEIAHIVATAPEAYTQLVVSYQTRQKELQKLLQHSNPSEEVFAESLRVARMLSILQQGNFGFAHSVILRAHQLYQERTKGLPLSSRERELVAVVSFRQASAEKHQVNSAENRGVFQEDGVVRVKTIGFEKIADIGIGVVGKDTIESLLQTPSIQALFDTTKARFLTVRYRVVNGGKKEYTAVLTRPGDQFPSTIEGATPLLGGRGFILPNGKRYQTHESQLRLLSRELNSRITVGLIYYRNGFAEAGGLEKTLRRQAQVLKDWGFQVRLIGGNPPKVESYGQEIISQFDHRVIEGAHERDALTLKIAEDLYRGHVNGDYQRHLQSIKTQLERDLDGVDVGIIHNPLFLRNVPFTQAVVDLWQERRLKMRELIGWVHDIGKNTEPERFHSTRERDPWDYAHKRFKGVRYVAVSEKVATELKDVPLEDPNDVVSTQITDPIEPGSDYSAMLPNNRAVETLREVVDWDKTDQLWVTTGRIAERKGTIELIETIAMMDRATLVVTGAPKVRRLPDGREEVADDYYSLLRKIVEELGIEDRVIFLHEHIGSISDREYEQITGSLFTIADGMVALPRSEGFGIDLMNAATLSPVVVATDDPAIVENLGSSATFVKRGAHPLVAAAEMATSVSLSPRYSMSKSARTERTWERRLGGILQSLGTEIVEDIDMRNTTRR